MHSGGLECAVNESGHRKCGRPGATAGGGAVGLRRIDVTRDEVLEDSKRYRLGIADDVVEHQGEDFDGAPDVAVEFLSRAAELPGECAPDSIRIAIHDICDPCFTDQTLLRAGRVYDGSAANPSLRELSPQLDGLCAEHDLVRVFRSNRQYERGNDRETSNRK